MIKQLFVALLMLFALGSASAYGGEKVDINRASAAQLQQIKGIGEKTAAAIVEYRNRHGAFKSVDELKKVKGIGEKKFSHIEDRVKVAGGDDEEEDRKEHKEKHHEKDHGEDD